jgi:hypothetical protein
LPRQRFQALNAFNIPLEITSWGIALMITFTCNNRQEQWRANRHILFSYCNLSGVHKSEISVAGKKLMTEPDGRE